jgi:hypothetical protein
MKNKDHEFSHTLSISDLPALLDHIAKCLDDAIEKTSFEDKAEWDRICTAIELLCNIAEDNSMFVRN